MRRRSGRSGSWILLVGQKLEPCSLWLTDLRRGKHTNIACMHAWLQLTFQLMNCARKTQSSLNYCENAQQKPPQSILLGHPGSIVILGASVRLANENSVRYTHPIYHQASARSSPRPCTGTYQLDHQTVAGPLFGIPGLLLVLWHRGPWVSAPVASGQRIGSCWTLAVRPAQNIAR